MIREDSHQSSGGGRAETSISAVPNLARSHPGQLLGLDQVLEKYRQKGSGKLFAAGYSFGAGRASNGLVTHQVAAPIL
jgi:hypothetical protein